MASPLHQGRPASPHRRSPGPPALHQQNCNYCKFYSNSKRMAAQFSAAPPAPPARAPTPPAVVVRQPVAGARNPWARPVQPPRSIEAGDYDQFWHQDVHICLHSIRDDSVSDQSEMIPPSPGPPLAARAPRWLQERAGTIDRWVEAQGRQTRNESEIEVSLEQLR